MSADLQRVLRQSIVADQDFIGWMQDIQATGCPVNTAQDSSYQDGLSASGRAVRAKKDFLALWNPAASQFGQPTYTATQI